jgi:hypothetical protein|tara:strand:- start:2662 stop:3651 length:990 start_codon:yes stop_codon:yes gene_type:complete
MDYNTGHATSQPIGDEVILRDTLIHTDTLVGSRSNDLSDEEINCFKTQGFVVKRGLVDDQVTFARVIDHVWNNVPRSIMQRDNPDSWIDKPHEEWTEEDHEHVGLLAYGNWKMRSRGKDGIGTEPFLVDRIANHANIRAVVGTLMGLPVQPVRRVRGIYCVFPKPPQAEARYGPHADYMAAQLTAMVVADSIPPHAGGFTVWPGSHLRLHMHWDTVFGGTICTEKSDGYRQERDAILREVAPVELTGEAGDVIFWHPRLLHSAGVNHSSEWDKPLVRVIVPCDYQKDDLTYYDDHEFGPGPDYQWWVDTRNFREDVAPTRGNVWSNWAI